VYWTCADAAVERAREAMVTASGFRTIFPGNESGEILSRYT